MKNIHDIEKLSFEEIERIADDSSVKVPSGLRETIEAGIAGYEAADTKGQASNGHRTGFRITAGVLAIGLAAAALLVYNRHSGVELTDTYSDPMMAYAEIEKRFSDISARMNSTTDKAEQKWHDAEASTQRIINNIMSDNQKQ